MDSTLTVNHTVGVYDLMEIRATIDVDRLAAGLTPNPYNWSNPAIVPGKDVTIRATHFNEMRSAIGDLWTAASIDSFPGFTRGSIPGNPVRTISLQDPTDLRIWLCATSQASYESRSWAGQYGRKARVVYRFDTYTESGYNPGYALGRRTEMWDASGHTRWTYDIRGRIIKEEKWIDGAYYKTEWTYDAMDRLVTMKYPDDEVVTYTYNSQLLLDGISGSVVGNIASDLAYNALDLPTAVKLPNAVSDLYLRYRYYGSNLDYSTTPYGALWDIRLEKTGSNSLRLEHGYDYVRNVTRVIDSVTGDLTFEYDELDRLLKRKITGGADQETFTYAAIGNIASKNGVSFTYHATKKHAVINSTGNPQQSDYQYDANGNMIQHGSAQFLKFDPENRMVKVTSDSNGYVYIARMSYDGDGRRAKRVDNFGTVHYAGPHYERNVGTGSDTTEVVTKFYYAQMGAMKRLIAFKKGSALYYVVPDHLGGTLRVVDTSGNTVDDIRYHAFGATRSGGTNTPTDKRFTGQVLDQSTGLYDYGARSLDPLLGRFCQPDSIVPDHRNPQSLNRYAYALNNPLKYIDPTGHYVEFVGGMGTDNDPDKNKQTWGFLIDQMGLREGEYGFFDWGKGWTGLEGSASTMRPLGEAAGALSEQIAGKSDVRLIGHSRGGALVFEYLAQMAEGKLPVNDELRGTYSIDGALAPINSMVQNPLAGERYSNHIGPFGFSDRYADLPSRMVGMRLTVDIATFDNPADFAFTTHGPIPGMPRYELAVGPSASRPPFPLSLLSYEPAAHGFLLTDRRVARYLTEGHERGW